MKSDSIVKKVFPFTVWAHLVNRVTLKRDLFAGITNAFVVLPQGIAFAMIAGLPPIYGLYTAIIPPIVAALFGSSLHLISGPTTAISIVVFSTISPYAEAGTEEFIGLVLTLTFLAGVAQLVLGLARMGVIVNFISHTVVIGFTAGAAILITTSQMKNCLGLFIPQGASFANTWLAIFKSTAFINPYSLSIALVALATVVVLKKWKPAWPGLLLAMITGSLLSFVLGSHEHDIKLVESIDFSFPHVSLPDFSAVALSNLSSGALAVAMLGLIEAVSIARSIAIKSKQRLDGNQEFIGQGLSNIAGSFFSCYASSGSFTRSGINYSAGAKTPMAAIFSAVSLTAILMLVAPFTSYLPIPAMGGIVLYVAYNLIDFQNIKTVLKTSKSESSVLITTFLATLFVKLEFAIYIGIILSLIFYLMKTSQPRVVRRVPDPESPGRLFVTRAGLSHCPQLEVVRIDGSIYFGSVNHVERSLQMIGDKKQEKVSILIVCNGINFIDIAGAEMLVNESNRHDEKGSRLYFCKIKPHVGSVLTKGGYLEKIGEENIFESKGQAIRAITGRLDKSICALCDRNVFLECEKLRATTLPPDAGKTDVADVNK